MTDLSALIARVEEGTDEANLCSDICIAVGYGGGNSVGALNLRTDPDWQEELLFEIHEEDEDGTVVLVDCCNAVPKLTTSLDAVLSLIEQKLPGWVVSTIGQSDDRSWWAELRRGHQTSYDKVALSNLKCASAPRAGLAAALRAIQSKEGPRHDA